MNILVLGKHGQVGESLVEECKKQGISCHGFGHSQLDITNLQRVKDVILNISPTVIINTTAFHVVSECEKDPQKAFVINATAVMHLAQFCAEKGIGFVSYSSDYVFDGKKGKPYKENDKVSPLQVYGVSKTAGEYLSLAYNPEAIIIRTSGVYGGKKGSQAKKGNFVINLLREAKDKKVIEVSSEQVVSTTYAVDLAEATIRLLQKEPKGGIYHLVNDGYCSWADFAKQIIKESGLSTKIIPVDRGGYSSNAHRPVFSALSTTKAARLGVKLPSWKSAIKRYVTYL
ncbi:MAG TPA: dTDP-4-dehydrorhamnose reductase [Patescibacteria group bacterium]|nr:dTDP-4-dehydrorhamnose reductase [Patescibacteria group bacterium]